MAKTSPGVGVVSVMEMTSTLDSISARKLTEF